MLELTQLLRDIFCRQASQARVFAIDSALALFTMTIGAHLVDFFCKILIVVESRDRAFRLFQSRQFMRNSLMTVNTRFLAGEHFSVLDGGERTLRREDRLCGIMTASALAGI